MKKKYINIEIFFNGDGGLQISKPQTNENYIWSLQARKDNEHINNFFNQLSKQEIMGCYEKDNNRVIFIENEKNVTYRIVMNDYKRLLNVIRFDKLDRKMNQFWIKKAFEKLSVKVKNVFNKIPAKYIVAGSILTTAVMIPTITTANSSTTKNNFNNNSNSIVSETTNDTSNELEEIVIDESKSNSQIEEIIIDENKSNSQIEEIVIDENKSNSQIDNNNIEILEIDDKNISQFDKNNTNSIDYADLVNFNSIDEYISFSSNLYGVDNEISNQLLKGKIGNMENYIINSNNRELKQLYELKSRGIINCDLDVMGSFVIIKDYAIDNLNLANQEPIISNKTATEKEQDMINIARYIYGIDDNDMLSTIIATHRLETGYGTSSYALKLNNLGGNMNTNPSQEQIDRFIKIINPQNLNTNETPIPNIYKTVEIGEESMVRNFLNVYSKCLHDEECLSKPDIASFLSTKYCTHTPEAWAQTINEMLSDGSIQETVETYINNKVL